MTGSTDKGSRLKAIAGLVLALALYLPAILALVPSGAEASSEEGSYLSFAARTVLPPLIDAPVSLALAAGEALARTIAGLFGDPEASSTRAPGSQQVATVGSQPSLLGQWWCAITGFLGRHCDASPIIYARDPQEADNGTGGTGQTTPGSALATSSDAAAPEPAADPASGPESAGPENATLGRPSDPQPSSVTHVHNTYPVIREIVRETIRSEGNGNGSGGGDGISQSLFDAQVDGLLRSLETMGSGITGDLAAEVATGLLTVTGNGSLTGSLVADGSVSASHLIATDLSATSTLAGSLTIGTTTSHDRLTLDGAAYLTSVAAPGDTASRLYNLGGDLYWGGSIVGGSTVGTWATDGTHAWRAGGNVGVGTSTPGAKLTVAGEVLATHFRASGGTESTFGSDVDVSGTLSLSTTTSLGSYVSLSAGLSTPYGNSLVFTNTTQADDIFIGQRYSLLNNGGFTQGAFLGAVSNSASQRAAHIVFGQRTGATAYAERMRIDSAGNVGIGTTSPDGKLDVSTDSGNIYTTITTNGTGHARQYFKRSGSYVGSIGANSSGVMTVVGASSADGTGLSLSGGFVGVGTNSPISTLQVAGTANASNLYLTNNASGNTTGDGLQVGVNAGATLGYIWLYENTDMQLGTNNQERLRITSTGNVGIGTTGPTSGYKLDVRGPIASDADGLGVSNNFAIDADAANESGIYFQKDNSIKWQAYVPGVSNDFAFWNGTTGSESLRIQGSTGNVGIGTTDPGSYKLNVAGHVKIGGNTSSASNALQFADTVGDEWFIQYQTGGLDFGENGGASGRLFLKDGGNVGIGTTNPGQKLTVSGGNLSVTGADDYNGYIEVKGLAGSHWTRLIADSYIQHIRTAGSNGLSFETNNDSTSRLFITAAGNVGIGTTSPGAKLHVLGANYSSAIIDAPLFSALQFNSNGGSYANIGSGNTTGGTATDLGIQTPSGSKIFLTPGGTTPALTAYRPLGTAYIGIGTTIPNALLHVFASGTGGAKFDASAAPLNIFAINDTQFATFGSAAGAISGGTATDLAFQTGANGNIHFATGGAALSNIRMTIGTTGNVGIGTTSPAYRLDVLAAGTDIARFQGSSGTGCTLSDGGVIACSSDERLKNDIADLGFGLDELLALRPVSYRWREQSADMALSFGFIAQEVEQVFSSLVQEDDAGTKSLNQIGLIPVIVSAIQEMHEKITELQSHFVDGVLTLMSAEITYIKAGVIESDKVRTKELCVGKSNGEQVCITGDELDALLDEQDVQPGVTANNDSLGGGGDVGPTSTTTQSVDTDDDEESTSTTDTGDDADTNVEDTGTESDSDEPNTDPAAHSSAEVGLNAAAP